MTQKVAVVAVHGVADQEPASSARAIADLLCTGTEYGAFTEVPLRIERQRMEPGSRPDDAGLEYMYDQLKDYRDPEAQAEPDAASVYDTVRLESKSRETGTEVHVHEVYWADLSRAGDTWYRLIAEFYQLILHLPSLGRNGLAAARDAHPEVGAWKVAHGVQRFAVWLLTVPALLINVVLLSIGLITATAEIPKAFQKPAMVVLGAIVLSGITIAVLGALKRRALLWRLWLPMAVVSIATAAWLTLKRDRIHEVLALEAALIAAGAVAFVAWKYSAMKAKAKPFGLAAAAVMVVLSVSAIWGNVTTEAEAYAAAVLIAQWIYPSIVVVWGSIFLVTVVAAALGVYAVLQTPKAKRGPAWRAAWTARFSLGLPTALFAVFTLGIWFIVIEGVADYGGIAEWSEGARAQVWAPAFFAAKTVPQSGELASTIMTELLFDSAHGFELFGGALLLFLAVALYAAAPSVIAEIKHPRLKDLKDAAALSTDLSAWLSRGITQVAYAAELFTIALVLSAVNVVVKTLFDHRVELLPERHLGPALAVTAAGIALILTGKRFIKIFRAAVDVLLDVDNYMRESPADAAPRARIAERFVSLLRHLTSEGYSRIVIVAHSQGTVISADVLRYLKNVPDPVLERQKEVPIRFLTMGSPLRQIYAQIFPYHYGWIANRDEMSSLTTPDPTHINVEQWANVYCSGDYVGRNLWDRPDPARLWIRERPTPSPVDPNKKLLPVVDICAGAGAHTHYWDANANDVGVYLKELLRA